MKTGDPYKNSFNDWLTNNALWIVLIVAAILVSVIVILFLVSKNNKNSKNPKLPQNPVYFSEFVGGKANILSVKMNGSRITLELKDYNLVDDEKLKENKVLSILKLSNKITLVCDKGDVEEIYNSLN